MKKFRIVLPIIIIGLLFVVYKYINGGWDGKNDVRMAIVTPDEVGVVVISPERKMVSVLKIDGKEKIWIPGGMGWYQSNRFKKIVEQEKIYGKAFEVFFYNLGFLTKHVLYLDQLDDWQKNEVLWQYLGGLRGFVRYKMMNDRFIFKDDSITSDLINKEGSLDEMMPRDFADNRLLDDNIRVSLINTTAETGMANFVGNRLSWAGFSVVAIENSTDQVENCLLVFGVGSEISYTGKMIKEIFGCQTKTDDSLGSQEIELYLGQKMAEMIKYSSYVGTL
jgi:hypothetical protein